MSEGTNKNNNIRGDGKPLEERTERVFDIYMKECGIISLNEKFISELERRMNSKVESKYVLKDKPEKRKVLYELEDSGEIIIDEEIIGGKIDRDIAISSYKKNLHDDICFYIIHSNAPQRGRAIFYENSDINIDPPKQLILSNCANYVREIHEKYLFKPTFLENLSQLEFKMREDKKVSDRNPEISGGPKI